MSAPKRQGFPQMNRQDGVKGGNIAAEDAAGLMPISDTPEGLDTPSEGGPNNGDQPSFPTVLNFANGEDVRKSYVAPNGVTHG